MAFQSVWYFTDLPDDVVNIVNRDLFDNFNHKMKESKLHGDGIDKKRRNSKNTWIPSSHWIAGFLWHYVQKANRDNFLYGLSHIDAESMQYTEYGVGNFYNWHTDSSLHIHNQPKNPPYAAGETINNEIVHKNYLNEKTELVRKLSFTLQLSSPDEYEGGNVQFIDETNKKYIAPRQRGAIILFDSRVRHRVLKVTKGTRRSIVGWVVGPRWV